MEVSGHEDGFSSSVSSGSSGKKAPKAPWGDTTTVEETGEFCVRTEGLCEVPALGREVPDPSPAGSRAETDAAGWGCGAGLSSELLAPGKAKSVS